MTTLDEAWGWYEAVRRQLEAVQRLGERHWASLPWAGALDRDPRWAELTAERVTADTHAALAPLDDLAVLVMFSVFEVTVRQLLREELDGFATAHLHPVLLKAVGDAKEGVNHGSFHNHVLAPFKLQPGIDKDLIEHVNQVRRYRNYVAHGRQGEPTENVSPDAAYARLSAFLTAVRPPAPE